MYAIQIYLNSYKKPSALIRAFKVRKSWWFMVPKTSLTIIKVAMMIGYKGKVGSFNDDLWCSFTTWWVLT